MGAASPLLIALLGLLAPLLGLVGSTDSGQLDTAECWTLFEEHKTRFANLIAHGGDEFYEGRFLHFLHVPRTAGRTFFSCFLRPNWRPSKRCPRAYDAIRLGDAYPDCTLLCSHDDFSISQFLPNDTAWMTQLRDPVDRFLSAYEMAVEVAVRKLARPANFKPDPLKTATKDVWPWSWLVEMLEDNITDR